MSREPYDDDRIVAWADLPPEVRALIGPSLPAGHVVWACPRSAGRGGVHIEWWWHNEHGDLVEAFWFD